MLFSRSAMRAHGVREMARQTSSSVPRMLRRNWVQGTRCLSRLRVRRIG
jgi:hypothetical protein